MGISANNKNKALLIRFLLIPNWKIKYWKSNLQNINVREYRRGNQEKENPKKLAIQGTQDEEKQSKNTTQYVVDITMRKQTQIT